MKKLFFEKNYMDTTRKFVFSSKKSKGGYLMKIIVFFKNKIIGGTLWKLVFLVKKFPKTRGRVIYKGGDHLYCYPVMYFYTQNSIAGKIMYPFLQTFYKGNTCSKRNTFYKRNNVLPLTNFFVGGITILKLLWTKIDFLGFFVASPKYQKKLTFI